MSDICCPISHGMCGSFHGRYRMFMSANCRFRPGGRFPGIREGERGNAPFSTDEHRPPSGSGAGRMGPCSRGSPYYRKQAKRVVSHGDRNTRKIARKYIPGESGDSAGHHGCKINSGMKLAVAQWVVDVDSQAGQAGSGSRKVVGGHCVTRAEPGCT